MNYLELASRLSILLQPAGLKGWARRLGETLVPGSCLLCAEDSPADLLCPACLSDLPGLPATRCPICADRTTHGERCGACLRDTPFFDQSVALHSYEFPVDRIVHALKYGHCLPVAGWSGRGLAQALAGRQIDRIIPLPLHPERLRERGFNQSAEIAKALGRDLDIPVTLNQVVRHRATSRQADLPFKARHKNVRGAFECHGNFRNLHLILVDDVMTTGATANECARTLKLGGAASVTVAVVARAYKD